MTDDKFVLSSSEFKNIGDAENKVNQWYQEGTIQNKKVKLYKTVEIYDLRLKFVKRKNMKGGGK